MAYKKDILLMYKSFVIFCCLGVLPPSSKAIQLKQHVKMIEKYIMNGHGGGWNHCDLLTDAQYPRDVMPKVPLYNYIYPSTPFVMST